jgi:NAD(P)-dependent dehydrogenase (short-subunit alcohol dehydrogenase family)
LTLLVQHLCCCSSCRCESTSIIDTDYPFNIGSGTNQIMSAIADGKNRLDGLVAAAGVNHVESAINQHLTGDNVKSPHSGDWPVLVQYRTLRGAQVVDLGLDVRDRDSTNQIMSAIADGKNRLDGLVAAAGVNCAV